MGLAIASIVLLESSRSMDIRYALHVVPGHTLHRDQAHALPVLRGRLRCGSKVSVTSALEGHFLQMRRPLNEARVLLERGLMTPRPPAQRVLKGRIL